MPLLVGLLSVLLPLAVFFILLLIKKTSWFNALFFAVFALLALLYLFRQEWNFRWNENTRPPVYFLIDKSLSVSGMSDPVPAPVLSRYPVYYFADTVSPRAKDLNPETTSLFDAIHFLKNTAGPEARIFVASDFNDNGSLNGFEAFAHVYPIVMRKEERSNGSLSLVDVQIPEFIESDENVRFTVRAYSPRAVNAELRVRDVNKIIYRKTILAGPGTYENVIDANFGFTGDKVLTFEITDAAGKPGKNPVRRSVDGISGMQKILLACGRPSEEFVFLKRFLEMIRWLKTETVLLKSSGDVLKPSLLNERYNAVILVDLSSKQANAAFLNRLKEMSVPVFYQTGLRGMEEIFPLVGAFTNIKLIQGAAEKKFSYNGNDLILQTSYSMENDLFDAGPRARIFFGWGTWKWDFIRLKEDIAYNNFDSFWQNQVNFILSASVSPALPAKLNFTVGEDPARFSEGIYTFKTNGREFYLNVTHRPQETADIPADMKTPFLYNTNLVFAGRPVNYPEWIRRAVGNETVRTARTLHIDFTRSWIALVLMALSLVLFWIFRDREETLK
jgi:hypothetical protein